MLVALSIRDVVLIERLSLSLNAGLCVLTGETGAGKSILLDALGLALGGRGDSTLVRHGSDQASVTAEFDLPEDHPAVALVREQGLEIEDTLVLRRVVTADGRSRAYVNDQAIGVTLLRRLGETLVEVHGQFDTHGLLNPQTHRSVLDAYAGLATMGAQVSAAYRAWRQVEAAREEAAEEIARARAEEDYLRHAVAELDELRPRPGEEEELAETRTVMMHREKVVEALNAAFGELAGERGVERGLNGAHRALMRIIDKAGGRLEPVIGALDRALAEVADAVATLQALSNDEDMDANALEKLEDQPGRFERLIEGLPFSRPIASQMIAIAKAVEERKLVEEEIPPSYSVAYQLTTLSDEEIKRARQSGLVRPDIGRKDIIEFKRSLRAAKPRQGTLDLRRLKAQRDRLRRALAEVEDSIRLLEGGGVQGTAHRGVDIVGD